ncbi:MAG: hypothetical protein MMC33_001628 [Icmadophila ericetorum]|nr:hypothetical protein [Icmadophila ericetorum]
MATLSSQPPPLPLKDNVQSRGHGQQRPANEVTPMFGADRGGGKSYSGTVQQRDRTRNGAGEVNETTPLNLSNPGANALPTGPERRQTDKGKKKVASEEEENDKEASGRWWKNVLEKYGSVELDNKGSVARDHLALERTFLAWLRTSLAFASIGIAVTQLFRLNTTITDREGLQPTPDPPGTIRLRAIGKPLGATFLGIAILVLGVGGRRYFESQYWIIRGKFPASRGSVCLITFVAFALIVTSLIVVCAVDPSQFSGGGNT